MGFKDVQVRTVKCDGPSCDREVVFPIDIANQQTAQISFQMAIKENPWLDNVRTLTTADGRTFSFCSDNCNREHSKTGQQNKPEPKKIVEAGNVTSIAHAARAAEEIKKNEEALKTGGPITIETK